MLLVRAHSVLAVRTAPATQRAHARRALIPCAILAPSARAGTPRAKSKCAHCGHAAHVAAHPRNARAQSSWRCEHKRRPARAPRRRAQLGQHRRERPRGPAPPARGAARAPRRGLARGAGGLGRAPRRALAGPRVRALGVGRADLAARGYICRSASRDVCTRKHGMRPVYVR